MPAKSGRNGPDFSELACMISRSYVAFARVLALPLLLSGAANAADPYLVADAETGDVLMQSDATEPWFPASTTKLMTTYVALSAVRDGRLTMDTPLTMSARAARSAPSKMGFRPGTLVTLDNALKMLMVKSPNDVAVMVAESISGSVESFADEMNKAAAKLGMKESHFVNPNGLHDPEHYSSARDMAILARALLKEFPEHTDLFDIALLQLGRQIIRNHNGLIGLYPGADGMKTGFTCPAGWNVVATAERQGRKLIVVVFGSTSPRFRNDQATMLFDRGFAMSGTGQTLENLPASTVTSPPDMRDEICRGHGRAAMLAMQEDFVASVMTESGGASSGGHAGGSATSMMNAVMAAPPGSAPVTEAKASFEPVKVFVGPKPGWTGPVLAAKESDADEAEPSPVSAFAGEKGSRAEEEAGAPAVLKSAVKPPAKLRRSHLTPQARARLTAAAQRVVARKTRSP
jgi:D-alanyl-D-alanine carboxypeptidase